MIIVLAMILLTGQTVAATTEPITLTLSSKKHNFISKLPLSQEDLAWLADKRTMTIAVYGEENPPIAMNSNNGCYRGINADYLQLLKDALHVNLVLHYYDDEPQALSALNNEEADLVLTSNNTSHQATTPFIISQLLFQAYPTLVTLNSNGMMPFYQLDKTVNVAVSQHYPSDTFIKSIFRHANIVSYSSNYQALASVAKSENDYFIGDNIASNFLIARDFYQKLDIVKYWRSPLTGSYFIARENQSRLVAIINKFISALDASTHIRISHTWVDDGNLTFLTKPLSLTPKEKRWIEKNPVLRTLVNPYYAPFTVLDENREIRGLVGDILNLVQLQTGLHFQPVIAKSNSDMAEIMRKGDWDMVPTVTYSPEREDEMAFTQPFFSTPYVVVSRTENKQKDIFQAGSTVAIPAYYSLRDKLIQKYPDVHWIIVENTSTALSSLNLGKVDSVVTTQLAARYIIDHYYPETMSYQRIPNQPSAQIAFAVPRDKPELQSILNKALAEIPPKETLSLAGKWIKMPEVKIDTWDLYSRPFYILTVSAVLLILSSLLWGGYLLRAIRREKASQAALEYQLSLRQTLSNSIPVPVYITTPEGEIESYNRAFNAFFTPQQREAIHYSLFDRRSPLVHIFPVIQQEMQQGLAPETVASHQFTLNNGAEDRTILHWMTLCPLPVPLPPVLICGWQDITESRKLMEALQVEKDKAIEASRAKSRFLARMSHEIRTPVSAIMGFLELLATGPQSEREAQESLQLAYATAQSLIGLIGDVLDMEKIESGNFELTPEWVDIEALTQATMANFAGLARQKNLQLTVSYQLNAGGILWLDPQAIKQVLANFLSNAIKFTVSGGVEIKVETQPRENDAAQLMLSVKDSGVGISEEEQQLLFKPFSQASCGKKQMGSGLGLTICKELMDRMHGTISVASHPGTGTTMSIYVQTQVSDRAPADLNNQEMALPVSYGLRVIIADDNPTNRLLLRRQLDILGYYVDDVEDGEQAFSLIKRRQYDLLITDLNMPGMDGLTLAQQVRKINPALVIWGLTANAQPDEKARCLASGMDLCLIKPVNLPQLAAAFNSITQRLENPTQTEISASLNTQLDTTVCNELIDMQALRANAMDDTAFMLELINQAYHENVKDLAALKKAMFSHDRDIVRYHLHRINGTAQLIGATSLHVLADKLENALASEQPLSLFGEDMQLLEQQLIALGKAMDNFLKREGLTSRE